MLAILGTWSLMSLPPGERNEEGTLPTASTEQATPQEIIFGQSAVELCGGEPPMLCKGGMKLGCRREDKQWGCYPNTAHETENDSTRISQVQVKINHGSSNDFLPQYKEQISKVPNEVQIQIDSNSNENGSSLNITYSIPDALLKLKTENTTCLDPVGADKMLYEFLLYSLDKEIFDGGIFYGNGFRPLLSPIVWNAKDVYRHAGMSDDWSDVNPGHYRVVLLAYHPPDLKCEGKGLGFQSYESKAVSNEMLSNLIGFGYSDEFQITK